MQHRRERSRWRFVRFTPLVAACLSVTSACATSNPHTSTDALNPTAPTGTYAGSEDQTEQYPVQSRPPAAGAVQTLGRAVEMCLARSPSLSEAAARVRSADAGLRQARAAMWPRAGADLALTWADAPSVYLFKTIDAHALAPGTDFNDPGSLENSEIGVAATWNLWRGRRDERAIEAAQLDVQARSSAESAQRGALIGMVVAAWLDHRGALELQNADDARIRMLEGQLVDARARRDSGAALEVDVLALEVRVAQAREARARSEFGARLALAALRELLALAPDERLEPDAASLTQPVVADTCEAAIALAAQQRAEIAAARADADAARTRVRAAQGAWSPRLDLWGRVWGDDNDIGVDFGEANSQLSLSLSFDALDGGARSAGIEGARAQLIAAESRLHGVELAVAHEVERAWIALESSRTRGEVAQQALNAAEQGAELVAKQLAGGSATTSRYLDAEADLARARADRVLAGIDLQRASCELLHATGTLEDVSW
jgi:outer membrane protein TolC